MLDRKIKTLHNGFWMLDNNRTWRNIVLLEVMKLPSNLYKNPRVNLWACKMGLHPRKRALSGLGLDLGVDQSPSPADRLASPFVGLASPFARLAEKRACVYFSSPSD